MRPRFSSARATISKEKNYGEWKIGEQELSLGFVLGDACSVAIEGPWPRRNRKAWRSRGDLQRSNLHCYRERIFQRAGCQHRNIEFRVRGKNGSSPCGRRT